MRIKKFQYKGKSFKQNGITKSQGSNAVSTLQTAFVTARPFDSNDVERIVTWHARGLPGVVHPSEDLRDQTKYMAVTYRSRDEACRQAGRVFQGPLAILRLGFGGAAQCIFIDPDLRNDKIVTTDIETLIKTDSRLCAQPRLAAA